MPDISDLREQDRPRAPKIPGATDAQRQQGRVLAMIHASYLENMAQLRGLVEHIDTDRTAAATLAETIDNLQMTRNLRTFGALCGRECHHLLFHHGAEEHHVFPALEARAEQGVRAVIAKLKEEHVVIHALLEALSGQANALMATPDPAAYAELKDTFGKLEAVLKSHFRYEETELEEALGFHSILI